jgi:hypothetical protein
MGDSKHWQRIRSPAAAGAKETKQEDSVVQGSEENYRWGKIARYLFDNPTLFLTFLYLYATGTGILYSAALYGRFGINIFEYSELPDFLLAAFKDLFVLLFLAFQVCFLAGILVGTALVPNLTWRYFTRSPGRLLLIFLAYIIAAACTTYNSAVGKAASIKAGDLPGVDVRHRSFSGSAEQVTALGLEPIGATQRAAFFYDPDAKRTIVIPQSQLVSIEVPEQD